MVHDCLYVPEGCIQHPHTDKDISCCRGPLSSSRSGITQHYGFHKSMHFPAMKCPGGISCACTPALPSWKPPHHCQLTAPCYESNTADTGGEFTEIKCGGRKGKACRFISTAVIVIHSNDTAENFCLGFKNCFLFFFN